MAHKSNSEKLTMEENRYLRQTLLKEIGEEGQRRLEAASVLIVGVGGLGSVVATYLNGAGIGKIGLIDNDTVSLTNLHRQILYTEAQIGLPKAECAVRFLAERSGHTELCGYTEPLSADNAEKLIGEYDVVVDCTDNFATRFLIDDVCRRLKKSWVYGAIGEFNGQMAVFSSDSEKRFTDLYPDREYLCSLPRTVAGVLGPLPGIIGSLEAMQTIKLIAGITDNLAGCLFTINTLTLETNIINF